MKFKTLRVMKDGEEIVLDGYYLTSEISEYSKNVIGDNQIIVQVFNPDCGAIFNRETFERVMNSNGEFDVQFGVRLHIFGKDHLDEDVYWFEPQDVKDGWELE